MENQPDPIKEQPPKKDYNPALHNKGKDHPAYGHHPEHMPQQFKFTVKEFDKKVRQYFIDQDEKEISLVTSKGDMVTHRLKIPYTLPALANYLGISNSTMHNYRDAETHVQYHNTMKYAVSRMEERILEGMLLGFYNQKACEFVLKNLKSGAETYADKIEIEKTGRTYNSIEVSIVNNRGDVKRLQAESEANKRKLGIDIDSIKKVEGEIIDVDVAEEF